jgi:hypothetical protein
LPAAPGFDEIRKTEIKAGLTLERWEDVLGRMTSGPAEPPNGGPPERPATPASQPLQEARGQVEPATGGTTRSSWSSSEQVGVEPTAYRLTEPIWSPTVAA